MSLSPEVLGCCYDTCRAILVQRERPERPQPVVERDEDDVAVEQVARAVHSVAAVARDEPSPVHPHQHGQQFALMVMMMLHLKRAATLMLFSGEFLFASILKAPLKNI